MSVVGGFTPSPYTTGAFYFENVKPNDLAEFDSQVMPANAKLGGLADPKLSWKVASALKIRPELKAKLEKAYPEIVGRDFKRPARKQKKKK